MTEQGVLFVAMPERHLRSAASSGLAEVVLPFGRAGDLPRTVRGAAVYVVTLDDEGIAAPAATWKATLVDWTEPEPAASVADLPGIPPSWLDEREARATESGTQGEPIDRTDHARIDDDDEDEDEDEDDDLDDDSDRPRQVLMTVEGLTPLDRRDWIFSNEVVRKQRRGARSFVPMTPTLVRLPD